MDHEKQPPSELQGPDQGGAENLPQLENVSDGARALERVKEELEKSSLPSHLRGMGIEVVAEDEGGGAIDIWQSDDALKRGELVDRIGRVAINHNEETFQIHIDSGSILDRRIIATSSDFEGGDKDAREAVFLASFKQEVDRGVRNPLQDSEQPMEIRDPRIQALINYAIALEKNGLKFDVYERWNADARFALEVREEQLDILNEKLDYLASGSSGEGKGDEMVSRSQLEELKAEIGRVEKERNSLLRLKEEAEKKREESHPAQRDQHRSRRGTRRPFSSDPEDDL